MEALFHDCSKMEHRLLPETERNVSSQLQRGQVFGTTIGRFRVQLGSTGIWLFT